MHKSEVYTIIQDSGLFDSRYYLSQYKDVQNEGVDPVEHFIVHGWKEGRNPSAEFDTNHYLTTHKDVAQSGMNPLVHYITHGREERRSINCSFQTLSFDGTVLPDTIKSLIQSKHKHCKADILTVITPKHTLFVAHLLYKTLSEHGVKVQILTSLPEAFGKHLHVILCPQIYGRMPEHYIAFQMEQLESSKWYDENYASILKQAIAIFDYSLNNIKYLYSEDFAYKQLFCLPIITFPNYQQFLIDQGLWDGDISEDKCDILFYGDPNSARRRQYFDILEKNFSIKVINEVFGNALYRELLSAKVIVNIHYYENALLETTRINESLSLGLNVVSEKSVDTDNYPELEDLVDFTEVGDVAQMVNRLQEILENRPKVSIVIPCYNQAQYLKETVDSIIAQTYTNIEIIIVNDGSTDNTKEVIRKLSSSYPQYEIMAIDQENQGLSGARNTGVGASTGEFIVTVDADDRLHSRMITMAMDAIRKHKVDIIYGDYQRFGEETTVQKTRESVELYDIQYANVTGATALYRKKVWEATGGYKKNMVGGYEDWEFWINASKLGFTFYHLPHILFYYRVKKESMYTDSVKKHDYLYSKVILNHPELYTDREIDNAVETVKNYEDAPALYFYADDTCFCNEPDFIKEIGEYLEKHTLTELKSSDEVFSIELDSEMKIPVRLYNLRKMTSGKQLSNTSKNHKEFSLYFSDIRYDVYTAELGIREYTYAWHPEKGCITVSGSIFPYVCLDDPLKRLEAYKRSEQYHHEHYKKIMNHS